MRALLESASSRACVNARDADGNTPLLLAARYGFAGLVRALIAAKADLRIVNAAGHTASDAARVAGHGSRETEDALIDAEIDQMG